MSQQKAAPPNDSPLICRKPDGLPAAPAAQADNSRLDARHPPVGVTQELGSGPSELLHRVRQGSLRTRKSAQG
jgi:hypothetical protein